MFAETTKKMLFVAKIEKVSEAKIKVFTVHAMLVRLGDGEVVVVSVCHHSFLASL